MSDRPIAIALSPILSARYRDADLARIRQVAPEARLVIVGRDGTPDGPLDEVEVMLRAFMSGEGFERVLARSPRLAWVHSAAAGVEWVTAAVAQRPGLMVTNGRGVFSSPIAQYVMMMILAVSRRLPQLLELQRERTWQPLEGTEMGDLTVGIVGLGSIGREVARLATAFGCRVVATRRRTEQGAPLPDADGDVGEGTHPGPLRIDWIGGPGDLHRLMAESNVVVLATPLTPATDALVNDAALAAMRPGAWLVNISRGRLIDERALLRALDGGSIGGAVLDAFRDEPLPPESPFYDRSNVIVTPHTSWSSGRVLDRSVDLFCDNLRRFLAREPLINVVDPGAGY